MSINFPFSCHPIWEIKVSNESSERHLSHSEQINYVPAVLRAKIADLENMYIYMCMSLGCPDNKFAFE